MTGDTTDRVGIVQARMGRWLALPRSLPAQCVRGDPEGSRETVATTIRTVFTQPTDDAVHTHLHTVADMPGNQFPKITALLLEAEQDLTAFAGLPERHWTKIWSTNPLERVNREIKRRIDVVQVLPNDDALLRLVTAVLFEMHDEWIVFPRRYLPEGSMDTLYPAELPEHTPALPNTTSTPAQ